MADLDQGRRFRKVDVAVPELAEGDSGQDRVSCGQVCGVVIGRCVDSIAEAGEIGERFEDCAFEF